MRRAALGISPSRSGVLKDCVPALNARAWLAASRNAREARLAAADMITVDEAAQLLGTSIEQVHAWIARGRAIGASSKGEQSR